MHRENREKENGMMEKGLNGLIDIRKNIYHKVYIC